jgi:hypothetical protein
VNAWIRRIGRAASASVRGWTPDALALGGVASMSYGSWLVYAPAGFIVAGVFLLASGLLSARRAG